MTVTSDRKTAARRWPGFLIALCASLLAGTAVTLPVFAQSAVTNTAVVAPPGGVHDPEPGNNSDSALLSVSPRRLDFGSCDGSMYLGQNSPTGLFRFDASTNPFTVNPVGPVSGHTYNAVAFHPLDHYIYAIVSTAGTPGTLGRIGNDGSLTLLGPISGLNVNSVAGEIGPDGTFYVTAGGRLYHIDIPSMSATSVALSEAFQHQDLAWHNGRLYAAAPGDALYAINPANGAVTRIGPTGVPNPFGAMFGASNGVFGGNNSGGFYRFDLDTGAATLISDLQGSTNNDGAKCATTPMEFPADLAISKESDGETFVPGGSVTYEIVVSNLGPFGVQGATVDDPLPAGISDASWSCGDATGGGVCGVASGTGAIENVPVNLPAGASVRFSLTLEVPVDFTGELTNTATVTSPDGSPDPDLSNNTDSETDLPEVPVIGIAKTADPAAGAQVQPGQTLAYTVTVTVGQAPTTEALVLVDTLGAGLVFGEVLDAGDFTCTGELECTLQAATPPGTYALTYTATVAPDATGSVGNSVVATGGGDNDPECDPCGTEHEVEPPTISVAKTAEPGAGGQVRPGDTITYTLTATVAVSATTEPLLLTDTLGPGLSFGEVLDAGSFACTGELQCTLAAGALPGTYALTYTTTVDVDATGSVGNSVVATGGGDDDPECDPCGTEHEVEAAVITTTKTADPPSGTEVRVGDVLTYTVTVTVANSATTAAFVLDDTLGAGQVLLVDSVQAPEGATCEGAATTLQCILAPGALPGSHVFSYQARVEPGAAGEVGNVVVPSGGGGELADCETCATNHPMADPVVNIAKASDPGDGAEVMVGDRIAYSIAVSIEHAALIAPLQVTDVPGPGLRIDAPPEGCVASGDGFTCTLGTGTVPGTYVFDYWATIGPDAFGDVENLVLGETTGTTEVGCQPCSTRVRVLNDAELRIVKSAGVRSARVGDLVRYSLTVENVGMVPLVDGTVVDTPPAGFSYVEGSMTVTDGDGAFALAPGRHPLRISGLDIAPGQQATIVYLLRVGAGVRHGAQINEAVARSQAGAAISNVATAQVLVEADPLLDDSLVFGTVFDDRDGDGWQDTAGLSGVRVQGGFAPDSYIAGSTTIDRGGGHEPVPDSSAPLLRGIALGDIAGRQSEGEAAAANRVVIRQRLREPAFTDDFVLTSDQGITLRMDAEGNTGMTRSGEAARGLTAAEPTVERRVAQGEGGVVVDYVIGNAGIDERGIPGVRIASVDGLLVETDQFGRYHLADVSGGERGYSNFILKVDPATLPPGTAFTTPNPRLRRITPGVPVRFDFGVRLPATPLPGVRRDVELALGEVIFEPGSAAVREAYLPAIAEMAAQVDVHGGGEVTITADGETRALAYERAGAVREALLAALETDSAAALTVNVHAREDGALVAGVTEGGALLGTVLFDTDSARIRPGYGPLLDRIAARLDGMGGGVVAVVGHADVRGSDAYNAELGMRRARAVFEALAERLPPEVRAAVRVESSDDPAAPVARGAGRGGRR